jgi:hypothetical protein
MILERASGGTRQALPPANQEQGSKAYTAPQGNSWGAFFLSAPAELDISRNGIQREQEQTPWSTPMRALNPLLVGSLLALPFYSVHILGAQTAPLARTRLAGIVVDAQKAPIASVELTLKREGVEDRVVASGEDGFFAFAEVPAGSVTLTARRLGYAPKSIDLKLPSSDASSPLEIVLDPIPTELRSVVVEESKQHLAEFYARKAVSNFAKFFDQKDVKKRNPLYLSDLLRSVAGSTFSSDGGGNKILLRGCKPMVWVDGMRAPGAELDEVARPSDIAGIEVYPSNAGLPAGYQDRNNRMCGAIIVWTRNQ